MAGIKLIKKRRKSALTNYKRRIKLLKSGLDRVVIRKSNRAITMQVARFDQKGDIVLTSARSSELKQMGWEPRANVPTAYLTGYLLAQKAKPLGLKECILDIGISKPMKSSLAFSAAKGCLDNGLNIRGSFEVDPARLAGSHISEYAKSASLDSKQFSSYKKSGFDVSKVGQIFEEVKKKIVSK
ncbi:MAG: 50S ribosomal protein L18 [Candidatus Micrarchaeia archaeon]